MNAVSLQHPGVDEMFSEQARRTPDAEALAFGGDCLTYRELDRRSSRVAAILQARGG